MARDGDIRRSLTAFERQLSYNRLALYRPYPKQREFHTLGATCRERCLFGANQSGKTLSLAMEVAIHATGLYPPWWEGRRFDKPVVVWCGGVTGEQTRDSIQRHLLGRQGQVGTGALPQARILDWTTARGVSGLADTVLVRHVTGGTSQVAFKTYARGREAWQGESCDVVALDEEPPLTSTLKP
jgi:phage terminase large subunit-like protein